MQIDSFSIELGAQNDLAICFAIWQPVFVFSGFWFLCFCVLCCIFSARSRGMHVDDHCRICKNSIVVKPKALFGLQLFYLIALHNCLFGCLGRILWVPKKLKRPMDMATPCLPWILVLVILLVLVLDLLYVECGIPWTSGLGYATFSWLSVAFLGPQVKGMPSSLG